MARFGEILQLIRLESALDLRQRAAWGGMLLYVVSAVYVAYLSTKGQQGTAAWNALFWIILVFAAFNTVVRSFQREDAGRQLYLHTLVAPQSLILARTFYNAFTMFIVGLVCLAVYLTLMGAHPLEEANVLQFLLAVVLGAVGLAVVLTLISAIASRAGSGPGLMAILGFPLVLPMLMAVIRASKLALDGVAFSVNSTYFLGLILLDVITIALAWILFPYLWRDR